MRRCLTLIAVFAAIVFAQAPENPLADARKALADFDLATADSLGAKALAQSPDSAAVHTFLGELRLRQGLAGDAEKELKKAIAIDPKFARAWYELSRVFDFASLHHTAEIYLVKAHDLAPDNKTYNQALARVRWRREHPDEERLTSEYGHGSISLSGLRENRDNISAFTVRASINGGKPLYLRLDTGASGILIRAKAAEKAELQKLRESKIGGVGDDPEREGWMSQADSIQFGPVSFANYPVEVTGKTFEDDDGLIGTDVFADFMVTLDFIRHKLLLDPLPGGMPDHSRTLDRAYTAELAGFSPIYRWGHTLLIPTKINDAGPFLFVIDTGSSQSLIAKKVAKLATKVHLDGDTTLKGLNGKVKEVSRADDLTIQFATFKQRNDDMIAFDLDKVSRGTGMEIGGPGPAAAWFISHRQYRLPRRGGEVRL